MKAKGPLRKVVGQVERVIGTAFPVTIVDELLECGHQQPVKSDCFGEYHAARRRCRHCAQEGHNVELPDVWTQKAKGGRRG